MLTTASACNNARTRQDPCPRSSSGEKEFGACTSTACTAPPSCVGILTGLVKIGARRSAEVALSGQCNATPHTDESDILGVCVLILTTLWCCLGRLYWLPLESMEVLPQSDTMTRFQQDVPIAARDSNSRQETSSIMHQHAQVQLHAIFQRA